MEARELLANTEPIIRGWIREEIDYNMTNEWVGVSDCVLVKITESCSYCRQEFIAEGACTYCGAPKSGESNE